MLALLLTLVQPHQISFSVFRSGDLTTFDGELGYERKVHAILSNGDEVYFDGERLAERKVVAVLRSGEVQKFEGARGLERKVRSVLPNGKILFFDGEPGKEVEVPSQCQSEEHFSNTEQDSDRALLDVEIESENFTALVIISAAVLAAVALGKMVTDGLLSAVECLARLMAIYFILLSIARILIVGGIFVGVVALTKITATAIGVVSIQRVYSRVRK